MPIRRLQQKEIIFFIIVLLIFIAVIFYFQFSPTDDHPARNVKLVKNCGPLALWSILQQYKIDASLEDIEKKSGSDVEGTTLLGLKKAAESYGFQAEGMRLSYEEMLSYVHQGFGVIAFINEDHYVWVKDVHSSGIVFKDLNPGFQFAPTGKWNAMWLEKKSGKPGVQNDYGICLIIKPNN